MKTTEIELIREFVEYYFQNRKFQYSKQDIPEYKLLINSGVLYEVKGVLEINQNSIKLNEVVFSIAETKLKKQLPLDISEGFRFIDEFDELLRREFNCERVINSFEAIIKGLKPYILSIYNEQGIDIKSFLFSLNEEDNRDGHLFSFEREFFKFLPLSNYSEKEIFEIIENLWGDEQRQYTVVTGLRDFPKLNSQKSKQLLRYALENESPPRFITDLLIGLYNSGEVSFLEDIIKLKERDFIATLSVLGRLRYKGEEDLKVACRNIGEVDLNNKDILKEQSYLIQNILESEYTTNDIIQDGFNFYINALTSGTEEIANIIFHDIIFLKEFENEKYNLLHLYLNKTRNFNVIDRFFYHFKDPDYIFDLMMRLFSQAPNYRFSIDFFKNGIQHFWNVNQIETEKLTLNQFEQHPAFGILGLKVIFSSYHGIYHVDFLNLEKVEHQLNAIKSSCKHPHSFDKLVPLLLPLRKSKFKKVREYLQIELAKKVFDSYHDTLFNQIKDSLKNTKKDKQFLEPIKEALDEYKKLKELKESINDLNPYENERDLMDSYYRLEHEENAKMMENVNKGGGLMGLFKTSIIVRGNSMKHDDKPPTPLGMVEASMQIDSNSYLNPDLFEHNLNN